MNKLLLATAFMFCLIFSVEGSSHTRWTAGPNNSGPVPMSNSSGIKDGGSNSAPCLPANNQVDNTFVKPLTANLPWVVYWEETINHNGWFEIYFSETGPCSLDGGPSGPGRIFEQEDNDCWKPIKKITDNQNGGLFSTEIIVPNVNCENCVFQIRQIMNNDVNDLYYSCAQVRISNADDSVKTPLAGQCKLENKPGFR